jgi:hypothetical protein
VKEVQERDSNFCIVRAKDRSTLNILDLTDNHHFRPLSSRLEAILYHSFLIHRDHSVFWAAESSTLANLKYDPAATGRFKHRTLPRFRTYSNPDSLLTRSDLDPCFLIHRDRAVSRTSQGVCWSVSNTARPRTFAPLSTNHGRLLVRLHPIWDRDVQESRQCEALLTPDSA